MRVSDSMMHALVTRGLATRQTDYYEAQQAASTGLKVKKPSDDPVAASLARTAGSRGARAETLEKMTAAAIDRIQAVDGTLNGVSDVVSRVRDIAVQGANDHLSSTDRLDMAKEVASLRVQLLSLANTEIDGEHVFSGLATDREAFDATGAFTGDATLREIEVGPGVRLSTQLPGMDIFGAGAGGVNAFTTLDAVEAALAADDPIALAGLLDDVGAVVDQVAGGHAIAGHLQQALSQAQSVAGRAVDTATQQHASLIEADPAELFSDLMRAEQALREAVAIASRLPGPSMLGGG
ncbi:MAG: flagellar hook-associated protein FlgL [Myxococcales bacterium]|nr:flagellar hook-associated protein FlgL [Myxococcales bacterium]